MAVRGAAWRLEVLGGSRGDAEGPGAGAGGSGYVCTCLADICIEIIIDCMQLWEIIQGLGVQLSGGAVT